MGPDGLMGHTGTDGSDPYARMNRYGTVLDGGENIAYGTFTGRDTVMGLVIDDGVASRGHRDNVF
jgi:uncharacterized protein YkwD